MTSNDDATDLDFGWSVTEPKSNIERSHTRKWANARIWKETLVHQEQQANTNSFLNEVI